MGFLGMGTARGDGGGWMNVIRCDEANYLVWKWKPRGQESNSTTRENSIRYGSSLRVRDGEVAVFVYRQNEDVMQDYIVGPYTGNISTKNFPVLAGIVGLAFGGESPFQAEVYFINVQGNNQLGFSVPFFGVADPRFPDLPVPVSVHGTLTFALEDYRQFVKLNRLIDFDLPSFRNQMQDAVVSYTAEIVANIPADMGIPLVQMDRMKREVSNVLESRLQTRMDEFGVVMKHIDVNNIMIDKASEAYMTLFQLTAGITTQTVQAQADLNIENMRATQRLNLQNMEETMRIQREEGQYAQHLHTQQANLGAFTAGLQADVLKTAAENMGQAGTMNMGGGNGGGMNPAAMMTSMMMGGAMGGQMAGMMNSMGQQMQGAMQTPPPVPQSQYMVAVNGQQTGPYAMTQLQQMAAAGQLTTQTYVWKQGMPQWELAGNVAELAPLFAAPVPPPIPGGVPPVPNP